MLDEYIEEDLFENLRENEDIDDSEDDLNEGNSPDAAPAATKLPQDMNAEERLFANSRRD